MGTGSTCVNNEDFNGTKFGEFACPLPGFKSSASYCCGSLETETQYCCEFFDEYVLVDFQDHKSFFLIK